MREEGKRLLRIMVWNILLGVSVCVCRKIGVIVDYFRASN